MNKFLAPALLAVAIGLAACGGSSSGVSTAATPSSPPVQAAVNARYQIVLKDVVTDTPITDPLVLTFTGTAALKAADGTTLNGQSVTTDNGFYGVDATFNTATNDFTVKVTDAGNKGWVSTGITVNAEAGAKGDRLMELKLINTNKSAQINASAQPVTMAVQNTAVAANGATTSATTVSTPPGKTVTTAEGTTETMPTTTVSVPTNTIATTASGVPASGQLTIAATTFSNANAESLQAFPGGFAANLSTSNAALLNGATTDTAAVTTGGFAQFTMKDSAGNEIRNFSQPVTVAMDLDKSTTDANGNPVAAGQQFPIWSFDEATQTWVFATMGTIAEKNPVDPKYFSLTFQTTHFSWWAAIVVRPSCSSTIAITGRPTGDTRELVVEAVGANGNRFYVLGSTKASSMEMVKLPRSAVGTVTIRDAGVKVGEVKNAQLCGTVSVPVVLQTPAAKPVGSVRFETSESCSDGSSQRAVPTFVNVQSGSELFPGYTNTAEGNLESFVLTGITATSVTANAFNPRTKDWVAQTVTVPANGTVTASFKFTTNCAPVTGGF